ncbi:subtilisin-like protein, partial [Ascoidea rubescens DSM 1968]
MRALTDAAIDEPDIISLSLGSYDDSSSNPISVLASNIAQKIPIILSGGNGGELGLFYPTAFASNKDIISVGSVSSLQGISWPAKLVSSSGSTLDITYFTGNDTQWNFTGSFPVHISEHDICQLASGSDGVKRNLFQKRNYQSNSILLAKANDNNCSQHSLESAGDFKYRNILMYTADAENYNFTDNYSSNLVSALAPDTLNLATVKKVVSSWVEKELLLGNFVTLEISAADEMSPYPLESLGAGKISAFSSWGPTFTNDFYPVISAPGADIFGQGLNQTRSMNGTSLSAPYIAGVIALYKSVFPYATPEEIRNKLVATASTLSLYNEVGKSEEKLAAPLNQQGAGLVNALSFVDYSSTITSNPLLVLNDTDNRVSEHLVTVYNGGCEDVMYVLSHEGAATIKARNKEDGFPQVYYPEYDTSEAHIKYSLSSFTLQPGESANVTVDITAPVSNITDGYLFSGKIVVTGSNGEILKVPYMGVELSTRDWLGVEAYCIANENGELVDLADTSRIYDVQSYDTFSIYYRIGFGSPTFAFDLVTYDYELSDFSYPPENNAKWVGPIELWNGNDQFSVLSQNSPSRFNDFVYGEVSGLGDGQPFPKG